MPSSLPILRSQRFCFVYGFFKRILVISNCQVLSVFFTGTVFPLPSAFYFFDFRMLSFYEFISNLCALTWIPLIRGLIKIPFYFLLFDIFTSFRTSLIYVGSVLWFSLSCIDLLQLLLNLSLNISYSDAIINGIAFNFNIMLGIGLYKYNIWHWIFILLLLKNHFLV